MMMNKKALAMSVFCAVASVGFVMNASAAEQMETHSIDEVVVEGQAALPGGMINSTARMGIMGYKDVMEIPYSQMSMTTKAVETFGDPSQPVCTLLANNPSIRVGTTSPMYTDFAMRGICMNGNHFMLNGVPSLYYQFATPPSHIIERIDITSGPSGSMNGTQMSNNGVNSGSTPAPGTINVTTKKATDTPVTRYTQTFSGRGNFGEFIDVGRRFGKDEQWGVRVNGEYMSGGLAVPGGKKGEKNIFVNLDHKDDKSTTNLFAGIYDLRIDKAQRWFTYNGATNKMIGAPNSKQDYDFKGTTKWAHGWLGTFNHDQKLGEHATAFVTAGYCERDGNKYNSQASLLFNDKGEFVTSNKLNAQDEASKNGYVQIGIRGDVTTGMVKHNLTLSADRSWAKYWNKGNTSATGLIGGSIYTGVIHSHTALPVMKVAEPQWSETNFGLTIGDTMEIGKANVFLAMNRKHENVLAIAKTSGAAPGNNIKNDNWAPSYGIDYMPTDRLAFYAGHSETMSRGLVVSDETCGNNGETMPPVKSKQYEVGVKYKAGKVLNTLAYFDITEANRYKDSVLNWYVDDGENRYKGVEYTANGQIGKATITGGFTWLNAQRQTTAGGAKDGWHVNGVAKWSAVIGAEYRPTDAWGFVGRVNMMDKCYIDNGSAPSGKTQISGYTTFDLGVNYKTKIGSVPVKLNAMCYNLTDKDYWLGRGGSTTFGLSMPRTFMLSAAFDL